MRSCSSGASGAEPDTQSRRDASSPTRGESARRAYIVGTPKNIVAPCVAAASSTASGENCGTRTAAPPHNIAPCRPTPRPCTWKSGSASTSRSAAVQRHAMRTASLLASTLPCVSIAPLGVPVVPDVYTSNARSDGVDASRVRASRVRASGGPTGSSTAGEVTITSPPAAARTHSPRAGSSTTAARGSLSRAMCATSRSRYAPFTGTTTRPSRSAATCATTRSTEVCALMRTRSPACSPACAKRAATSRVRSSRSAARTVSVSVTSATASGAAAQRRAHAAGSDPSRRRSIVAGSVPSGR